MSLLSWLPQAVGLVAGLGEARRASRRQSQLENAQLALANLMREQYAQYAPQALSLLWSQAQRPEADPWYRAQFLQALADAERAYQTSGRDVLMEYAMRGGGRVGESLGANAVLAALQAEKARQLAQLRVGQLGEMYGRRQAALSSLLGAVSPLAMQALGVYGTLGGQAAQTGAQAAAGIGDLLRLWALGRPAAMTLPASATTLPAITSPAQLSYPEGYIPLLSDLSGSARRRRLPG